jgi:DNA-binding NtrC family response regulator
MLAKDIKKGQKILVVDNEEPICINLKLSLSFMGYKVVTAKDGLEALGLYKKNDFDLVLTDVLMPEMDGLQLYDEIKKKNPDAIVYIMSGTYKEEEIRQKLKKGVAGYIQKPFNLDYLLRIINCSD